MTNKERNDYVSQKYLCCIKSFDSFNEGEHYWLEYIPSETNPHYFGRSDNVLNKNFVIDDDELMNNFKYVK